MDLENRLERAIRKMEDAAWRGDSKWFIRWFKLVRKLRKLVE